MLAAAAESWVLWMTQEDCVAYLGPMWPAGRSPEL